MLDEIVPEGSSAKTPHSAENMDEIVSAIATDLGVVVSRVGVRAGLFAPPALAQAVLEGVFWCR